MKNLQRILLWLLLPLSGLGQAMDRYSDSIRHLLSAAPDDTVRMKVYASLGDYYILDNRDSAVHYINEAYPLSVRLDLKLDQAAILNSMGILQMQQEKYSKSLEYYLRSIHITRDPSAESTVSRLLPGQTPMKARMLELSRSYDYIGLLNAYTGNWTENFNNQMKNYREAEKYAAIAGDEGQIATVVFHKGIAYLSAGQLDSAQVLLAEARKKFAAINDPQLGRAFIYTGETYEKMGDLGNAAVSLQQALALLNKTNDNVHRGLAYLSMSRIYAGMGKMDSALYCAHEGFRIFEKRKDAAWKRDASNLLASFFDKTGKADSATFYLKLAKSLTDSLGTEERKNLLAFQDVLIDEQLKLEALEKERIQAREKLRTYLLLSGIGIVIAVALFLYRNNRSRKRTNEMLQQRNQKIEHTLNQLRAAQAQLVQSEKMASLGELTAGIAHEIQNPLNFVNNFSEINTELTDEILDAAAKGNLGEVTSLAADIRSNQQKILEHGKRADSIVKSMLEHSRSRSGNKELTDLAALADEYLRLAYHGMRAKNKSFNASLKTELDSQLPRVPVVSQDISRVLLNLFNNAFYAMQEKAKTAGPDYQPALIVSIGNGGGGSSVFIRVADNGTGIPPSIKEKIFQPFFTTKPTGQGTGLGLSLSYDIIKSHGGDLKVEKTGDEGTAFTIVLPAN